MYETYSRYIYEWLVNTFFPQYQEQISSILIRLDSIFTVLQYGLYLGCFAFLYWVFWSLLRPHFFKT